ncbi:1,4-alpha-glucan branching protein GlgB [Paenibacillus hamazuiensis]|uniref:1,4-alpha-glucan branching protein GlgB n=1 Tax=Paenibacillus hamazuiensis TaxID=2936508 RepID=UPI002010564D|nr:1,4-alpha-glucan branching protein GlgB [Paenibacillus hamazuiensis]
MTNLIPSSEDLYLFHEGSLYHSYRMLGAHFMTWNGIAGVRFAVWAPHARAVRVAGDFNGWDGRKHPMAKVSTWGVWSAFIPGVSEGQYYKYEIETAQGTTIWKADPYAFYSELKPGTASRVYELAGYEWNDGAWFEAKRERSSYNSPMLIYEVHLGTWKKHPDGTFRTYRELADDLVAYAVEMGYTHIELLPLAEHPYDRSWGYQATGYYSVTSRFGTPKDFMYFVDRCHQSGLGVIMDWVPGHFVKDDHGLRLFDGQPLYEPEDPRLADKKEWGTLAFDFSKPEVVCFLISNAVFWMEQFHIDGLRVDAVASMLSLNFMKPREEWIKNRHGGDEHLDAIAFLKKLNETVFAYFPDCLMMAEDSSDWPLVTTPVYTGGLGFNYKWNMGWMNDMLKYMEVDPYFRRGSHRKLTFSFMYTYSENYVLPLSHDEVVHGKKSLLNKMPGDYWQKFANLRALYGYMMAHPGKKLLFMGGEFGQFDEWKDLEDIDWEMIEQYDSHRNMFQYTRDLNRLYRTEPSLWELDHRPEGFEWIDPHDDQQSIVTFMRKAKDPSDFIVFVCNFTPVVHHGYRIGVPMPGEYIEFFNSDMEKYGGSGVCNPAGLKANKLPWHNRPYSIEMTIPPLGAVWLKPVRSAAASGTKPGRRRRTAD